MLAVASIFRKSARTSYAFVAAQSKARSNVRKYSAELVASLGKHAHKQEAASGSFGATHSDHIANSLYPANASYNQLHQRKRKLEV